MAKIGRFELSYKHRNDIIDGTKFNIFNGMVVVSIENDAFTKVHHYVAVDDSFENINLTVDRALNEEGRIPKYFPNIDKRQFEGEVLEKLIWEKIK